MSISVMTKKGAHPRSVALIGELSDIVPGLVVDDEAADIKITLTEDVGPQFITFKSAETQLVFKIIDFRSRADLGIQPTIRREPSQLVLSNFTTDVGLAVAEFLMGVFPISLESNQVVNFTVHKDFIFFRMYRFCIRAGGPSMEKIGPHLTLRLWRMTEYRGEERKTFDFKKYVKNLNLL